MLAKQIAVSYFLWQLSYCVAYAAAITCYVEGHTILKESSQLTGLDVKFTKMNLINIAQGQLTFSEILKPGGVELAVENGIFCIEKSDVSLGRIDSGVVKIIGGTLYSAYTPSSQLYVECQGYDNYLNIGNWDLQFAGFNPANGYGGILLIEKLALTCRRPSIVVNQPAVFYKLPSPAVYTPRVPISGALVGPVGGVYGRSFDNAEADYGAPVPVVFHGNRRGDAPSYSLVRKGVPLYSYGEDDVGGLRRNQVPYYPYKPTPRRSLPKYGIRRGDAKRSHGDYYEDSNDAGESATTPKFLGRDFSPTDHLRGMNIFDNSIGPRGISHSRRRLPNKGYFGEPVSEASPLDYFSENSDNYVGRPSPTTFELASEGSEYSKQPYNQYRRHASQRGPNLGTGASSGSSSFLNYEDEMQLYRQNPRTAFSHPQARSFDPFPTSEEEEGWGGGGGMKHEQLPSLQNHFVYDDNDSRTDEGYLNGEDTISAIRRPTENYAQDDDDAGYEEAMADEAAFPNAAATAGKPLLLSKHNNYYYGTD